MSSKAKQIGTRDETAVVRVLRLNGFGTAERAALAGVNDRGDITGTPGLVWEVKGGETAGRAEPADLVKWLNEAEVERANVGADFGLLILKRKGIATRNAHRWWCVLPVHQDFADLVSGQRNRIRDRRLFPGGLEPVFTELDHVLPRLRLNGYGDPLH